MSATTRSVLAVQPLPAPARDPIDMPRRSVLDHIGISEDGADPALFHDWWWSTRYVLSTTIMKEPQGQAGVGTGGPISQAQLASSRGGTAMGQRTAERRPGSPPCTSAHAPPTSTYMRMYLMPLPGPSNPRCLAPAAMAVD